MTRIRWTTDAVNQLEGIVKHIQEDNPDAARKVAITSTKSMTGHMMGASGALEAIVCALAIRDNRIPPTINLEVPDPECDLDYNPNEARSMRVDVALSNSIGLGGHNASLVLRRV